ncbi:L-lactate permease [Corynebacterium sp. 153RC1]|uniref:L-lactate permease n=1 Tax=Corynebacterium TaxID=1716 RepID=UPI00211C10A8|nr:MULTISPECIES: L-lactate permease [unclassified Corynebacterium]MCQ9369902.1 L-lactate permease [Corynebacterium sp. 35RC1]MCQ9343556.1 L-lactate permease [Corynebacterium sp. 76QC2CO]MCQ9352021.1 L-lactate permease [Corynebacterium sp. 209RC1]MCQ9353770.1 L-lactate permease [Corynebacterium sp. 1222RC1]MCQ9356246.1 L-lactate permease [Corynebacterium sp. 122RC1]
MFTAVTNAVGGSLGLSAATAIVPLLAFFVFLMVLKWPAHWSALASTVVALLSAIFLFGMPAELSLMAFVQGAAFGLFPIVYIIWMAVWIYDLTVATGRFDDLRAVFSKIGRGDMRVQAMLIGFAFGGLLEALAGFGAPIAIVAAMLVAIGLKPIKAVLVTFVANCSPVAFGAMGIPVATGGLLAEIPGEQVAAMAGRQVSLVALIVPFILAFIMDGVRGMRQTWPMALLLGVSFGGGQFIASNYFSFVLTDVVACLISLAVGVAFLRVWKPVTPQEMASEIDPATIVLSGKQTGLALFPYLLIVVVFSITSLWRLGVDIPAALKATDIRVEWPVTHGAVVNAEGEPVTNTIFNFNWLSTPGTILMICGLITLCVYVFTGKNSKYAISFAEGIGHLGKGAYKMRFSALTIAAVMGLAYVMNLSGQTASIGAFLAATGAIFPLLSPVLGWLGTWVTGSATSANALFAQMQATTAGQVGVSPTLLVGANTAGATLGKMMSPQTLAIAANATGMQNGERVIMSEVWKYSLGLLLYLCILVYLQSTPVLGWMVVG